MTSKRPADAVDDLPDEHREAVTRARAGAPVTWFALPTQPLQ